MIKKLLPHIAAVLTFAALTIIYFLPYYQDMTLSQGDVTQWEGMSKEIVDWNQKHPDDPALWTDGMFGGMPAVQISLSFTGNLVSKLYHVVEAIFPVAAGFMFMMFLGFYILLLCLDVSPWLSMGGALAYGLSSFIFISIDAGHNTKVQAMSLMAPALGGVILAYRKHILLGGAITALFLAMTIDSNHMQVAYYLLLMMGMTGVYYLVISVLEKRLAHFAKATGILIIAGVLALLPSIGNLWSTQEYAKQTIRGGASELTQKKQASDGGLDIDYATKWSYGLTDGEILTIMIPDMKGGGGSNDISTENGLVKELTSKGYQAEQVKHYLASVLYWGNQPFTSGPVYFGAAIVFLFIFSMFVVRSNIKWLFLAITIFSILLACGHNTPFFKWMFNLLPFFNKFRTPAMALVIAQLTMPLMAILGLSEIFKGEISTDELMKKLKISAGIAVGIVLVFGAIGSFMYSFSGPGDIELGKSNPEMVSMVRPERASMLRADAFRSLFFIIAAAALVWAFAQKKVSQMIFTGGIVAVFLLDGWMVAKRYLNSDNFVETSKYQANHVPSQADVDILKDTDPDFRVFNVTRDPFNDAMTSYYHKSVGGYHAAKLIIYQDLIENQIAKNNIHVLNMLNTKYVIAPGQRKEPEAQRNPGAAGNAWFIKDIKWAKNADEEMADLTDFNEKSTLIVDQRYKAMIPDNALGGDSAGSIRLLSYSPNKLVYASNSASSQVAVFSEIYYDNKKGWNAYVDGKPADHFRADYVLRAMVLPAGAHQIEFKFEPKSIVEGNKIAYAGSFLLFLFAFGTIGFAGYKKYQEIEAEPKPEPRSAPAQSKTVKPIKKK
ncbi:MAG: putative rane protein [Bacteroidota bacterium]|nr:putative rane protein [Bacteroidota bacterium]